MAQLNFTPAPAELLGKKYSHYREWLDEIYYYQLCSYCLLQYPDSLQIEHYEPQEYAADRVNDPTNLLLGCSRCNGGKNDYHPEYVKRRRLPGDTSGFLVIDIRAENFSALFEIKDDGAIYPNPSTAQRERVKFNILTLLRLNGKRTKQRRVRVKEYLTKCEQLLATGKRDTPTKYLINLLVQTCAENYLFYKAFDIQLTNELKNLIENYIATNKSKLALL